MIVKKKGLPNLIMNTGQNVNHFTIASKSEYYITKDHSALVLFLFFRKILPSMTPN
jgi:hypothetical protein